MSAEILNVTAEVVRNASIVVRAKNLANAHPIAAAAVGTATVGMAAFGTYKAVRHLIKRKTKSAVVVQAPKATVEPVDVKPAS